MGYAVLHLDKASGNEAKMTAHIERTQMPKNADPERTYLNLELIEFPEGVTNRTEGIQHRLDNAGLTRKIGTNQVRAIRIMLTGSHDDMKRIEAEGRLGDWCDKNLDWLRKTYGADNLVSAVLHMDEATPHIHATVVPIVTGERRKVKEKKQEPGKKKYRKKSPHGTRLCADDVMTRVKLKEYQDSYAEAMSEYGLERGIVGSEARHITTHEFYRNAIAQKDNLQEDIQALLEFEERKRKALEQLKQKEQEARVLYNQLQTKQDELKNEIESIDTILINKQQEVLVTEQKITQLDKSIRKEKLKSKAVDTAIKIVDKVGSFVYDAKGKEYKNQIRQLYDSLTQKEQTIAIMNTKLADVEKDFQRQMTAKNEELKTKDLEIKRRAFVFPFHNLFANMLDFLYKIGIKEQVLKRLFNFESVRMSGKIYSHEYKREYSAENSVARLNFRPTENRLDFLIDDKDYIQWFREKHRQNMPEWERKLEVKKQQSKGLKI